MLINDNEQLKTSIKLEKSIIEKIINEYKKSDIDIEAKENEFCFLLSEKQKAIKLHNYLGYLFRIENSISSSESYWQQYLKCCKEKYPFFVYEQYNLFCLYYILEMLEDYLFLNKKIQEFVVLYKVVLTNYDFLKKDYLKTYKKYLNLKNEYEKKIKEKS